MTCKGLIRISWASKTDIIPFVSPRPAISKSTKAGLIPTFWEWRKLLDQFQLMSLTPPRVYGTAAQHILGSLLEVVPSCSGSFSSLTCQHVVFYTSGCHSSVPGEGFPNPHTLLGLPQCRVSTRQATCPVAGGCSPRFPSGWQPCPQCL